jgi:hypothetical protein
MLNSLEIINEMDLFKSKKYFPAEGRLNQKNYIKHDLTLCDGMKKIQKNYSILEILQ